MTRHLHAVADLTPDVSTDDRQVEMLLIALGLLPKESS